MADMQAKRRPSIVISTEQAPVISTERQRVEKSFCRQNKQATDKISPLGFASVEMTRAEHTSVEMTRAEHTSVEMTRAEHTSVEMTGAAGGSIMERH